MTTSCLNQNQSLLRIESLRVVFGGETVALDGISLTIEAGEAVSVIGPSGAGKSTLAKAVLGLLPPKTARGRVLFQGKDILGARASEVRRLRGRLIGYIGQDPYGAFDPLFRLGTQLREALRCHGRLSRREEENIISTALSLAGLTPSPEVLRSHPHELSGGMLQRAQIAAAFLHRPRLLVADEPTTGLDPIRKVQLVRVLASLVREVGCALLVITHELDVARALARRVVVVEGGRLVEEGNMSEVLERPRHKATVALVESWRRLSGS